MISFKEFIKEDKALDDYLTKIGNSGREEYVIYVGKRKGIKQFIGWGGYDIHITDEPEVMTLKRAHVLFDRLDYVHPKYAKITKIIKVQDIPK